MLIVQEIDMQDLKLIPQQLIENRILIIRGRKVMLDRDLAMLYGVETFNLNKAVKRNIDRFPEDFMFQLNNEEFKNLIFHFGISSWGGTRKLPYAFTENGVAMLSSVLNSKRAIQVNIQIMRTFTKIREMLATHKELRLKIEKMEKKYDSQFKVVFDAIKQLMEPPQKARKKIGFLRDKEE
jgi:phage regulator Rha-like protein